ncbi:MAG TPA: NAD-dependent epimerase/dehydratase family protein, partial [Micromonosporaceae bacterium]|nr:NAD-dependent epimerase/dehydratase family protein [Micromonosporaceae bacterium]
PGTAEDGPVVVASADAEDVDYAQAKRGGELAVEAAFGERAVLARVGLVLGPYENIGRLPWWLRRIAHGGDVIAPGPQDLPLQYLDVRDLANWSLGAVEQGLSGPYNVVSSPGHTTMGELLESCVKVTGADARLHGVDPETLLAAGVQPWTGLPIWLPPGELYDTLYQGDVSKALASGLRCRPVSETVADTWAWLQTTGESSSIIPPDLGLDPSIEAKILATVTQDN